MADEHTEDTSKETTETETTETEGSSGGEDKGGQSQARETTDTKVTPDDDWKSKSRKHEDRAKSLQSELEKAQARIEEFESASKSDTEKLTDRATKAEKSVADLNAEVARLRVAMKKNLTEAQAKRLIGETEEELEADADQLLADFQKSEKSEEDESKDKDSKDKDDDDTDKGRRRPKERLKTGATGDTEPEETDPAKLAARVGRGF
jgi:hypothetical protein